MKSEKAKVKIVVYDIIGNEVAVLVDGQKSSGIMKLILMQQIYQAEFITISYQQIILLKPIK